MNRDSRKMSANWLYSQGNNKDDRETNMISDQNLQSKTKRTSMSQLLSSADEGLMNAEGKRKTGIDHLRDSSTKKLGGGSQIMFQYKPRQSMTGEHGEDFAADEFD